MTEEDLIEIIDKQSEVIGILFTIQEILLEEMDDVPSNAIGLNEQAV